MIEKILVKSVASFDEAGIEINNFNFFNFIYGSNGTGKTTISNVLRNPADFPDSEVVWKNNIPIKTFVYNQTFKEKNFNENSELKGIFTLGEESKDINKKIEEKNKSLEKIKSDLNILRNEKIENDNALAGNKKIFEERCWSLKKKYEEYFKNIFVGYNKSKERFMGEILSRNKNTSPSHDFIFLKEKYKKIYESDIKTLNLMPLINDEDILSIESNEIFKKRIVGKKDIPIADLINKLNNNSWVDKGKIYLDKSNGLCPFCQQKLPDKFQEYLEKYFDDSYKENKNFIEKLKENYKDKLDKIIFKIQSFSNYKDIYKIEKVNELKNKIKLIKGRNSESFQKKLQELDSKVELESLESLISELNDEIKKCNEEIKKNNNIARNISEEKMKINKEIWDFLICELKEDIKSYENKRKEISTKENNRTKKMRVKEKERKDLDNEINELESKRVSIKPTINSINKILKSFNFIGFKLKESTKAGYYEIIRNNGNKVKNTLSEGEKTFIAFLYFYSLIKGSLEKSQLNTDKIIVIDDPISSLDSEILFVVSHLIEKLILKKDDHNFKQFIILTHNIYFHKRITRKKKKKCSFWIMTKKEGISNIKYYRENPIKSSYELLWQGIKTREGRDCITICNTLRRILEYYFTIIGNYNEIKELSEKFESNEKLICDSLIKWVNGGSHDIDEDLYYEINQETVDKYLQVFKEIFKKTRNLAHYEMMMGIDN